MHRHLSSSGVTPFQRPSGWSAEEVARLRRDDPHLLQDQQLATWREMIISKACKHARRYINDIFPENGRYTFCKLQQWPTVMPWIAQAGKPAAQVSTTGSSAGVAPVPSEAAYADDESIPSIDGPLHFRTFNTSSTSAPYCVENALATTTKPDATPRKSSTLSGESPLPLVP